LEIGWKNTIQYDKNGLLQTKITSEINEGEEKVNNVFRYSRLMTNGGVIKFDARYDYDEKSGELLLKTFDGQIKGQIMMEET